MESVMLVLGKEYDADVRQALFRVLRSMHAALVSEERGVAGSQDIEILHFRIDDRPLIVTSETYIGLSIEGEEHLVLLVQSQMNEGA